jgi:ATPase subunit of ABC transporter with duplicated ATPase domains
MTYDSAPASLRLSNQVVELAGVAQRFGDQDVVRDVDLAIEPAARLGIVGPNCAGKSTLLDIIAGRRHRRVARCAAGRP